MKELGLFVIGIAMTSLAMSQTASPKLVSSSGDSFNNSSYQLDWSVGECVTAMHSAGSYVITQGLHQNSYVVTTVENLAIDININAYPNPTTDLISVDFTNLLSSVGHSNMITVTDINGKVLQQVEVTNDVEQLNFSNYTAGIYFLTVNRENKLIKSFKIIKNYE